MIHFNVFLHEINLWYFLCQPLPFELIKGKSPSVGGGYIGEYVGINCRRLVRKLPDGTKEVTVTRTKRNCHASEEFPTLVGVQCMDGGKYHDGIAEGTISEEEYLAAWKASSNRAMDFGTTGKYIKIYKNI